YSGNPAFPLLSPLGVKGAPTKTHLRNPVGNVNLPSGPNTAVDCGVWATAGRALTMMNTLATASPAPARIANEYFCITKSPFGVFEKLFYIATWAYFDLRTG